MWFWKYQKQNNFYSCEYNYASYINKIQLYKVKYNQK